MECRCGYKEMNKRGKIISAKTTDNGYYITVIIYQCPICKAVDIEEED